MIKVREDKSIIIDSPTSLLNYVSHRSLDAIVVEGYEGVGKGKVLDSLSKSYNVTPYRPDYYFWQQHDHRKTDRWKVSGFFLDVFSHFKEYLWKTLDIPMLFDRGVISGAVYNEDSTIAAHYKQMLRDMKVLHILVTCSRKDYERYAKIRGHATDTYDKCLEYTLRYIRYLDLAGVDYIIYDNRCDESLIERLSKTCAGCGHYSYGWCRHPVVNCVVDSSTTRCEFATDSEVQDTI